jgi:hypothetical protein
MQVNQLIVLPDAGTLNYLREIFSGCPFDIDLSKAYVEVNSSLGEMQADDSRVYTAAAGSMNVWYDSSTQATSLLLPLQSPTLTDRCMEIRETAPSLFYGEYYMPFVVLQRNIPPMRRAYRSFINAVSDVLFANRLPLVFESEFLLPKNFEYVPYTDYYVSQLANNL